MLARSILRLLPPRVTRRSGRIRLGGVDLTSLDEAAMRGIRGGRIGIVFQDPGAALDPVQTVGAALREALRFHGRISSREIRERSARLLEEVALPDPDRRLGAYPHELSGGMRQRVMIAIALAAGPALLVADEPTASLDRCLQREILDLLDRLRKERGLSVLLITHDIRAAGQRCGRIAVMYAGRIVEEGPARAVLDSPGHPYTAALMACLDRRLTGSPGRLPNIPGQAPRPSVVPGPGCSFAPRCPEAFARCGNEDPPPFVVAGGRVRCFLRES